jgi:hypothetical protein
MLAFDTPSLEVEHSKVLISICLSSQDLNRVFGSFKTRIAKAKDAVEDTNLLALWSEC